MNLEHLKQKTLAEMTGKEFLDLQSSTQKDENHAYGIFGLMELFNCSRSTAIKIKNSGKIDAAITQIGRTIVIDRKQALELTKGK